jgi:hypothetical protein
MSDHQREAALNRARVQRHREKLRTPEIIEEDQTMEILKRQGYAVDTDGMIEPYRRHESDALVSWDRGLVPSRPLRYSHQHLAVIQINTNDSKLVDAVVATVDEPGALVGISKDGAVLVFRIGDSGYGFEVGSPPAAAHEFVTSDGKAGLFTSTVNAEPLDVAAFSWKDGRSPLTVHVMLLPPMHLDVAQAACGAVSEYLRENGGRFGPVPPEDPTQRMLREWRARRAAGVVDETPEEAAAREDEALVAANPNLRPTDGLRGSHVDQARKRIEARAATKAAEKKQQADAVAKARFKEIQAKLGNVT